MSKIYVITKGSYSDYRIHSIWSTKEKAQQMHDILAYPDEYNSVNDIEEYDIDTVPVGETYHRGVEVTLDFTSGKILKVRPVFIDEEIEDRIISIFESNGVNNGFYEIKKIDGVYYHYGEYRKEDYVPHEYDRVKIYVTAETEELAKKIAFDYRAQKLAELEQIT